MCVILPELRDVVLDELVGHGEDLVGEELMRSRFIERRDEVLNHLVGSELLRLEHFQ